MAGADYTTYLARFDERVGRVAVGAYGKWQGKLVRKLAEPEFDAKQAEYASLEEMYRAIVQRGDTINDTVVRLLRERAAELILDDPLMP